MATVAVTPETVVEQLDLPVSYDERAVVKRLGLIALSTDLTCERDLANIIPREAMDTFTSRVTFANPATPENLAAMAPRITESASQILSDETLDVVLYACTAASVVIGDDAITAAVRAAKPGVPVVTPPSAACAGLRALRARRISLLTPYLVETTEPMAAYFERAGLDIVRCRCLGLADDRQMARISRETLIAAAEATLAPGSEALFMSCTGLRSAEIAQELEQRLDVPVVTSNQAAAWAAMRLAGITTPVAGYGRLLGLDWPASASGT